MKDAGSSADVVRDLGPVVVQQRGLVRLGEARRILGVKDGDTLHMLIENGRIVLVPVDLVPKSERYLQSSAWAEGLRAAVDDVRAGRVKTFDHVDDLMKDLRSDEA